MIQVISNFIIIFIILKWLYCVSVMRCEPEIEGIKDMEKKVNETNDISGFVVALRKKFKTISASI